MDWNRNIENIASFRRTFWLAALVMGAVCIVVAILLQSFIIQIRTLENDLEISTLEIHDLVRTMAHLTKQKEEAEIKIQETKLKTETEMRNLQGSLIKVTKEKDDTKRESKQQIQTLENNLETSTSDIHELERTMNTLTRQKEEDESKIKETKMRTETEIRNLQGSLTKVKREKDDMKRENKQKIQTLENNLEKSTSDIHELERTMNTLTRQKEEAENRIKEAKIKAEIEVRKLQASLTKVTKENDDTKRESKQQMKKIKSLETTVKKYKMAVKKHEHTLDELGLTPGSTYHPLKTNILDKSFILQCLHLKYDTEKVNLKYTHINDAGELVNKPDTGVGGDTSGRFQNYCGTTSTAPLLLTDSPQYIEVLTNVEIARPLKERNLVLETGICRERNRDLKHYLGGNQYCYTLFVTRCPEHNSVCTAVRKDGHEVHHLPDTLPNTAGSHTTLHHGAVFDTTRNRIVFLDVKQMKVIGALDNVDYTQPMWPMFGVYNPHKAAISMKLVVGNDIDMTPEKKAMILKAL